MENIHCVTGSLFDQKSFPVNIDRLNILPFLVVDPDTHMYLLRSRNGVIRNWSKNRNINQIIVIPLSHFSTKMAKIGIGKGFVNSQKYFPPRAFLFMAVFWGLFLVVRCSDNRTESGKSVEFLGRIHDCGFLVFLFGGFGRRFDLAKIILQNY